MRRIHITPATLVAFVALFFSVTGAGIAASRYLITSTRQIAPSVRYALRGHRGPQGAPGVQGPAGPQGAQGPPGPQALAPAVRFESAEGPVVSVPAGADDVGASAHCPGLMVATGGGYVVQDSFSSASLVATGDEPQTSEDGVLRGWLVTASNPTGQPLNIRAWVVCAT